MLDRIDIHIEVTPVSFDELSAKPESEGSEVIRERVIKARTLQEDRFEYTPQIHCNAQLGSKELKEHCGIDPQAREMLKNAMRKLSLSARAYDRILKVARTIADLDGAEKIDLVHLAEAINYRSLDRENWAA